MAANCHYKNVKLLCFLFPIGLDWPLKKPMKVQTEVRISDIDSSLIVPHRPITTEDQEEPSANQNVPHEGRSMLIGSQKRSARTILEPEIGENC